MTRFQLAADVSAAFPGTRIAVVAARGVRSGEPWSRAERDLSHLEQQCRAGTWSPAAEDDPRIASWHEAYRRFGTNPRRTRPSVDALSRRLSRAGRLPRICPPVDCYNLISVRHAFPAGAFDCREIDGDVSIRFARDGDTFTPLGDPDATETPKSGEVVYADAGSVLTRHWNHRDAERTKVTASSADVVFLIETADAAAFGSALAEAAAELASYVSDHASEVCTHMLDQGKAEADLRFPRRCSPVL